MDTRTLGSLEVSVVGLGTDNFGGRVDLAGARNVIDAAIDVGVTFFDTADTYGATESERFIGEALLGRRDRVVLATKFGSPSEKAGLAGGARPEYVRAAVEASLRRLRTDRIDLYQLHVPDPTVPIAETLGALKELVDAGRVLEVGCSNFSAAQLEEADRLAAEQGLPRFVSVQNEYNLLRREAEKAVLPAARRLGVGFLPYYPLLSGIVTGKYRKGRPLPPGTRVTGSKVWEPLLTAGVLELIERLVAFAEERGHELLDLAFAWLLAEPAVKSVIAGATSAAQVVRNARTPAWRLTDAEKWAVDELLTAGGITPDWPPSLET